LRPITSFGKRGPEKRGAAALGGNPDAPLERKRRTPEEGLFQWGQKRRVCKRHENSLHRKGLAFTKGHPKHRGKREGLNPAGKKKSRDRSFRAGQ